MSIVNRQFLAIGLNGYNHPLMVDVHTTQKYPNFTVSAIQGLLEPFSIYAKKILENIAGHEVGSDYECDIEKLLSEQRTDDLTGGSFVLLGKELTKEQLQEIIAPGWDEPVGPDAAVSLEGVPEVVFSFHANNNNGGPTYVMSRLQFRSLFPNEVIEQE